MGTTCGAWQIGEWAENGGCETTRAALLYGKDWGGSRRACAGSYACACSPAVVLDSSAALGMTREGGAWVGMG